MHRVVNASKPSSEGVGQIVITMRSMLRLKPLLGRTATMMQCPYQQLQTICHALRRTFARFLPPSTFFEAVCAADREGRSDPFISGGQTPPRLLGWAASTVKKRGASPLRQTVVAHGCEIRAADDTSEAARRGFADWYSTARVPRSTMREFGSAAGDADIGGRGTPIGREGARSRREVRWTDDLLPASKRAAALVSYGRPFG